jgi:two-component system KDP operon response regulator KdpE
MVVLQTRAVHHRVSRQVASFAGARILVVEDDDELSRVVKRRLRRHNLSVELVTCAEDARVAFEQLLPDLVVLDLDLADASGPELLVEIRAQAATPVLALSTLHAERNVVAMLDQGADDYLTKPFGLDELIARIRVGLR